jgi:hypothetical protein
MHTAPSTTPAPRPALAPISTMLTPNERLRVDAAGAGLYRAMHRDSLEDVIRDVRERGASAVVVSVARCGRGDAARVAMMVREFPRVPAVALLTELAPATPQAVLSLGRSGVRSLVDVRQPSGWRELRQLLMDDRAAELERAALARLATDLEGAPDGCRRFFDALFTAPATVCTVRRLAAALGVVPSTLMSRFLRRRPAEPKRYLAMARLARAARCSRTRAQRVQRGHALRVQLPQSFGRHVRTLRASPPVAFRHRYDGDGMVSGSAPTSWPPRPAPARLRLRVHWPRRRTPARYVRQRAPPPSRRGGRPSTSLVVRPPRQQGKRKHRTATSRWPARVAPSQSAGPVADRSSPFCGLPDGRLAGTVQRPAQAVARGRAQAATTRPDASINPPRIPPRLPMATTPRAPSAARFTARPSPERTLAAPLAACRRRRRPTPRRASRRRHPDPFGQQHEQHSPEQRLDAHTPRPHGAARGVPQRERQHGDTSPSTRNCDGRR